MSMDELKSAWSSLTHGARAFTNRKGWNNGYCDFINRVNLDSEPMGFEPIWTGGALLEILGPAVNKVGKPHWPVRVLTPSEVSTAEEINHDTRPEVVFFATVTRRERLPDGTRRVNRFPQLMGKDVPVPLFSTTAENYIRGERVRLLPRGAPIPNPYNPPL